MSLAAMATRLGSDCLVLVAVLGLAAAVVVAKADDQAAFSRVLLQQGAANSTGSSNSASSSISSGPVTTPSPPSTSSTIPLNSASINCTTAAYNSTSRKGTDSTAGSSPSSSSSSLNPMSQPAAETTGPLGLPAVTVLPSLGMQQVLPIASLASALDQRLSPTANLTEPERLQLCSQPPESGPCRASIPRWHYEVSSQSCKLFVYGGCGGNGNNFAALEGCRLGCRGWVVPQQQGPPGAGSSPGTAAEGQVGVDGEPLKVTVLPSGSVVRGPDSNGTAQVEPKPLPLPPSSSSSSGPAKSAAAAAGVGGRGFGAAVAAGFVGAAAVVLL